MELDNVKLKHDLTKATDKVQVLQGYDLEAAAMSTAQILHR